MITIFMAQQSNAVVVIFNCEYKGSMEVYLHKSHCNSFEILLILTMGVLPMACSTLGMMPTSCFLGICSE